jgi:sugar lactone lactonase YvrE
VAVSPDGESVYVAAVFDDALVRFDRDPATGALTPQGCIEDNDPPDGSDACAQGTDGLAGAQSIAVSSDGRSVYVASDDNDAVVRLDRDLTTGALTPQGCVDDNDPGDGLDACAQSTDGLAFAKSVAVSADERSVYVAAGTDDAVVLLAREPDPPQTKIKGPRRTAKVKPKFRLSSDEPGSTFECKLDKRRWKGCDSPYRTPPLDPGRHRLKARATDPGGNTDPTPAKKRFRIEP